MFNYQIKVSVVLALYNESLELAIKSIRSICEQTYSNIEILLIFDDPSNSDLIDGVEKIFSSDFRVRFIRNDFNMGLACSLNKGIKLSSGKYIVRMDADDVSLKDRVEKQVDFMERNPDISLSGMFARLINDNNEDVGSYTKPVDHEVIKDYINYASPVLHPTWIVKSSVYKELNYYDDITPAQDYAFLIKLIDNGYKVSNIPEFGLLYRINSNSLSHHNACKTIFHTNILRSISNGRLSHSDGINKIKDYQDNYLYTKKINNLVKIRSGLVVDISNEKIFLNKLFSYLKIFIICLRSKDVMLDTYCIFKSRGFK